MTESATFTNNSSCNSTDPDNLKKLRKTGVINAERYNDIADLYRMRSHLLIADGGEGSLHGDPADALQSEAERIVQMIGRDNSRRIYVLG